MGVWVVPIVDHTWWLAVLCASLWVTVVCDLPQVEERSKLNRQSSPALQHKVSNRISDPSLPPRSESFSSGGMQPARTPPIHRSNEPQVCVCVRARKKRHFHLSCLLSHIVVHLTLNHPLSISLTLLNSDFINVFIPTDGSPGSCENPH